MRATNAFDFGFAAAPSRTEAVALSIKKVHTLNHMVQLEVHPLDLSFSALSDVTRRGVLEELGRAEASITCLAGKFHMTLTGMKKHVAVLERAGLVVTEKVGRVRTCKLGQRGLEAEAQWLEAHRKQFEARFAALDNIILEIAQKDKHGPANA